MMGHLLDRMVLWDWLTILLGVVSLVAVIALVLMAIVLASGKSR
jgi:hypothetical protein